MNLEQRVETLEQELQVLKSQIQATLLDLQEFMLTNSYPTLRADDQAAPSQPAPAPVASQPATARPAEPAADQAETSAPGPYRQVPTHEHADSPPRRAHNSDGDAQVRVKKIASVDTFVRHPQQPEPYDDPYYPEMDEPANTRRMDDYDPPVHSLPARRADEYDEPAHSLPARRNGHHHRQPARNEPGWFDQDQDDPDDDYPRELQGWVPPFLTKPVSEPASIPNADWANLYTLEEWVQKRIDAIGTSKTRLLINRYSDEGHIDPLLRVMMFQLVSIITEQQNTPAHNNPRDPRDGQARDVTHDMVLKMIARLQNTGLTRRKNHG